MEEERTEQVFDTIDHVAIPVPDVNQAVAWYTRMFRCKVCYQDETWALLGFANVQLALVLPRQHPPHIAFRNPEAAKFGGLTRHRDGTRSVYITDPFGNTIEMMEDGHPDERRP